VRLHLKFWKCFRVLAVICALVTLRVPPAGSQVAPSNASKPDSHGIAFSNVNQTVKPGDDFYQYANGSWLERTQIPADRASVGVFTTLSDLSNKRTVDLIEKAAKGNAPAASDMRKIADLYNSFINEVGIEAKGLAALRPHLQSIAAIHDKKELARALGESLRADVDALNNTNFHTANLFGLWVAPGFNDSDHYTAYLLQGGLQLPDREYYIADTERTRDIRAKYQAHIAAMLKLAGFDDTDMRAKRVFELEHEIAEKHISLAENEDIHKANNT
jgi:putative endopeptidase